MNAEHPTRPSDLAAAESLSRPTVENLPAALPPPRKPSPWRGLRRFLSLLLLLLAVAGTWYWRWLRSRPLLPAGFASGNGRLEADWIDIDTKFAGRILKLCVDEGLRHGSITQAPQTHGGRGFGAILC
jgi:HlyD family secretion protein